MLASGTPFFQEFHCVLQDDALGLLIKPMNDIPVVRGLKPGADGMPGAAERAGVTVGSILVAVNGRETLREGFKATMLAAKTASRPVTLGFRRLHAVTEPVPDQGPRPARRYWQGYLFARFAAARSWTGRFYVLREDGELRAYPGKDLVDGGHVEDLRVVHAPLRASAEDVAAAARTVGDLGDDGRGSLDPRAFAAPVVDGDVGATRDGPSDATRWAFFRGETPEARLDWIAALTTLAVAFEEKGDDDGSSADAGATTVAVGLASAKREVARQGYLWVKAVKGDEEDDEETRGVGELVAAATAAATLEVSQRLAPWRRRWFVLSEAGELLWYVSPPADDGEVPTGRFASLEDATVALAAVADRATLEGVDPSEAAHRRRRFEFSVREARGERRTVKLTALSAHEGKQWVAALEAAAALKVEPLPVVDDGGDDDAAGPTTEEPCDEEPVEKPRPPSRSPSVPAAKEPAREKPREVSDEKDREARLIALSANPGVVLKLPEAAYGLLVPRGSGGGGVDRGAFTALAGQRLVPLCDCYVADLVYDALLASQAAGGARDSPQTVAQNTGLTKVLSLGKTESPRGDVDEDFLGKNLLGKIGGLKAYTSAKKGLTRAAADAGAVVSELLYEAQAKGLKSSRDAAAKRASANVQTSRRAAEPIQGTSSLLGYDAFRRYCDGARESFGAVPGVERDAWDDLRVKLGLDKYEMLALREDYATDVLDEGECFLEAPDPNDAYLSPVAGEPKRLEREGSKGAHRGGVLYLTNRHLLLHRPQDATVRLIPLDFVEAASPAERGEAAFVLKKAEVHTIRLGAKSKDEEEPEDTLSPLGAYPGGGRIFGNDSTFHQPLLSLEALREADGPPLPEAKRHEADADGSDVEDAVALGLEDRPRKARRRPSSNGHPDDEGQRYECARVSEYAVHLPRLRRDRRKRDREHLWLESVVELVAAVRFDRAVAARDGAALRDYAPPGFVLAPAYSFDAALLVRDDASRFPSQGPLFETRRRPGGLWAAANVLRRAALLKACRRLPKGLAFFSAARREREPSKPLADYLVGEGVFRRRDASVDDGFCARMEDRSWLRGLLVFAARSDDLDRRWAKETRSFAPARFRDEWHVFWAHVDPIWDGFYDTAVSLRRWDWPAVSGGLCGGLLLVAYADALAWLPCLLALAYAAFVVFYGAAVEAERGKRRAHKRRVGVDRREARGAGKDDEPGVIANLARRLSLPSTPAKPGGSLPPEAPADDGLSGDQPSADRSPAKSQLQHLAHEFGVFGQLRELRQGLGKAQAKLHEYNTYLLQCRALHRWADPDRTWLFVAGLLLFALAAAVLPLNYLFASFVLYFFSPPLFKTRGVSRATQDEYFEHMPVLSRTHGNVHVAALRKRADHRPHASPLLRALRRRGGK